MIFFILSNFLQILINPDVNVTLVTHNSFAMGLFLILALTLTMDTEDNLSRAYKYLRIISIICSLGLFIQLAGWALFNVKISLFIPGIERIAYQNWDAPIFRPGGFIIEPSHFSIYLLPVLALSLVKKDYLFSVFSFTAILISTSSLGTITGVLVILWHFKKIIYEKINSARFLIIGIILLLIILFLILFESNIVAFTLNKLLTIFGKASSPRLLGSLNYIGFFGLREYIFGIGLNQFSYMVGMKLGQVLTDPNYSNSIVFSFISFGIIGLSVWILYLISVLRRIPERFTSLGIILLCMCATDQVLFNHNLLYMLVIISIVSKNQDFQKSIIEKPA
jgi:hypothetical protein